MGCRKWIAKSPSLVLAVLFVLFSSGLMTDRARAESATVRVLSLNEAQQVALEKNRDIHKAREYRNLVEGRYVEERAAALPQFVISAYATRSTNQTQAGLMGVARQDNYLAEIGVSQPLFTWGQIGAAIQAAKYGVATADDQLRIYRQAALRDTSSAFYDVLLAKEFHGIAVQNLGQKAEHLEEARKKFAAGVATEYDVLAAEVEVENARPEVIRTENQIRTSRERLRFILGLPGEEVDTTGELIAPLELPSMYDEALDVAWKKRPELSDLRNRLGLSQELVKVYSAGNKPRLDLKASTGWRDINFGDTRFKGKEWLVGLFATYPIFDGFRTDGKVAQAKSEASSLKIEEAKLLDSIALQIRDTVNAVRESADIARALSGTVTQADRLLYMAEKGFEYGVKTKLDVDDAALNSNRAKANLAKARRDYLVARVALNWAMGILGE
jgi:outer membrane protein TolC